MSFIWDTFTKLANRRQSGFGVNPLSDLDLQAYKANRRVDLSSWEVDLIFRLDDKVLEVMSQKTTPATSPKTEDATAGGGATIPVQNVEGVRTLFQSLKARREPAAK